jgi:hypothetical protein
VRRGPVQRRGTACSPAAHEQGHHGVSYYKSAVMYPTGERLWVKLAEAL